MLAPLCISISLLALTFVIIWKLGVLFRRQYDSQNSRKIVLIPNWSSSNAVDLQSGDALNYFHDITYIYQFFVFRHKPVWDRSRYVGRRPNQLLILRGVGGYLSNCIRCVNFVVFYVIKGCLPVSFHSHTWQGLLHLSCDYAWQIWLQFVVLIHVSA